MSFPANAKTLTDAFFGAMQPYETQSPFTVVHLDLSYQSVRVLRLTPVTVVERIAPEDFRGDLLAVYGQMLADGLKRAGATISPEIQIDKMEGTYQVCATARKYEETDALERQERRQQKYANVMAEAIEYVNASK